MLCLYYQGEETNNNPLKYPNYMKFYTWSEYLTRFEST